MALELLDYRGTGLVLALAGGALVGESDHRRLIRPRGGALDYAHLVADGYRAALEHTRKHALARHDAVAHGLVNCAVAVALLAYLRHFEQHLAAAQQSAHGEAAEVEAADDQVLAEVAVDHLRAPGAEGLYLVGAEQADLAVPFPGVRVAVYAPLGSKVSAVNITLLYALFGAGTYCEYGTHMIILQSVT